MAASHRGYKVVPEPNASQGKPSLSQEAPEHKDVPMSV